MNLVSMRIITNDVERLVSFYEMISSSSAARYTPDFAELTTPRGTLAIGSTRTLSAFGANHELQPEANRSVIIEFMVEDVDAAFLQLKSKCPPSFKSRQRCLGGTAPCSFATPMAT